MAPSPSERVSAVEKLLSSLSTRVDILVDEVNVVNGQLRELTKEAAELNRNSDREGAKLSTRLGLLVEEVKEVNEQLKELTKMTADSERERALLKRESDELKKWKDEVKKAEEEWGRKLWMIVPPVAAVVVSNLLTIVIMAYFKK
jgi:chromosome segregation ATPase